MNVRGWPFPDRPTGVFPAPMGRLDSCHYCLSVILDDDLSPKRPAIMEALTSREIGSSIYYPQPVPRMSYYREKYGYDEAEYTQAARISDKSIALPVGPHLSTGDMKTIATNLIAIIKGM